MKFRRTVPALICCSLLLPMAIHAGADSQTARIKAGKGTKTGLEVALNPNNGDVLIVFEEKGQVFSAKAAEKKGKYKAKKAKALSKGSENYRPTVAWDDSAGEFVVAWDTGPADLEAATARLAVDPADIKVRRVKAKNGKGLSSEIEVVSDGKINLGPDLRRMPDGEVVLHFVQNEDPTASPEARFAQPIVRMIRNVFRGEGDDPEDLGALSAGLVITEMSDAADGEILLGFTHYLTGNPTGMVALSDLNEATLTPYDNFSPTLFPFLATGAAAVAFMEPTASRSTAPQARVGKRTVTKYKKKKGTGSPVPPERRTLARAAACDEFPQGERWLETFEDLEAVHHMIVPPSGICSGTNFAAPYATASRTVGPFAGTALPTMLYGAATSNTDGVTRLYEYGFGTIDILGELFQRSREIRDMQLLTLPDGERAILVWIEEKNTKSHEVWMHIFDLP